MAAFTPSIHVFLGQLINCERKYKPIWSFALLTNYDGTKTDKKQSNVEDDKA
jgi:hypothetical protein